MPIALLEHVADQSVLFNEDGTPSTWIEPLPAWHAYWAFTWRGVVSAVIGGLLWAKALSDNSILHFLAGMVVVGSGVLLAAHAFTRREFVRKYSYVQVPYTLWERIGSAGPCWLLALLLLFALWEDWSKGLVTNSFLWYGSVGGISALTGIVFFGKKTKMEPTAAAVEAMALERRVNPPIQDVLEAFLLKPPVRYLLAILCLCAAYYFAYESTIKKPGMLVASSVAIALLLCADLLIIALVVLAAVLVGWLLFTGIAALPVSVAVIIGAYIIADAMGKRR